MPACGNDKMLGFLDRDRTHLSVYAKAMFGLALERLGEKTSWRPCFRTSASTSCGMTRTRRPTSSCPTRVTGGSWYGSEIETDAFYLKLLARTDPKGELAPRLVKYVLNNRRHGSYWNSTRDTAFCIEALADYLKASGEDRPDMTVTIAIDGQTKKEVKITPADLFRLTTALCSKDRRWQPVSTRCRSSNRARGRCTIVLI